MLPFWSLVNALNFKLFIVFNKDLHNFTMAKVIANKAACIKGDRMIKMWGKKSHADGEIEECAPSRMCELDFLSVFSFWHLSNVLITRKRQ